MTESELIDKVLQDAKDCSAASVRSNSNDYQQALEAAKQWGLIAKADKSNSYCLTEVGKLAMSLGGFDKWLEEKKQTKKPRQNIHISGSVTGSQIGQDSLFRDLTTTSITSSAPIAKEKRHNAIVSAIEKFIVPIILAVIGGVILLYIEHKTGFFNGK